LKLKPGNGYMLDSLGWVHFKKNKYDSAVKNLKAALEVLPDDVAIIEHLGDVYVRQGRIKDAEVIYTRALKADPKNNSVQKKLEDLTKKKTK
jgi:Tfp pilus assembly protein PilF